MYYVIQENVFQEIHYDRIKDALKRLDLEYEIVKLGTSESFKFNTNKSDVFCFGSIKLARLATEHSWNPGSLMNSNHDYTIYADFWKNSLLNYDSTIQDVFEEVKFNETKKFIRPTKDSKLFTGKVFSASEWLQTVAKIQERGRTGKHRIQVAIPKKIFQEIRCWVVNKKVVTASIYKLGDQVRYIEYTDSEGIEFAEKMAAKFQPAPAFVLDICRTEAGWKIVEVNCINSAGFYAANLQKLIVQLEDHFYPYAH